MPFIVRDRKKNYQMTFKKYGQIHKHFPVSTREIIYNLIQEEREYFKTKDVVVLRTKTLIR